MSRVSSNMRFCHGCRAHIGKDTVAFSSLLAAGEDEGSGSLISVVEISERGGYRWEARVVLVMERGGALHEQGGDRVPCCRCNS